jgi:N-glycosylase/DNA lyase
LLITRPALCGVYFEYKKFMSNMDFNWILRDLIKSRNHGVPFWHVDIVLWISDLWFILKGG